MPSKLMHAVFLRQIALSADRNNKDYMHESIFVKIRLCFVQLRFLSKDMWLMKNFSLNCLWLEYGHVYMISIKTRLSFTNR